VNDQTGARAGRRRRDRPPRNRQRERVLSMVREYDGAVDAFELASRTGLHITTVRFHLDALCDDGVVARTRMARPGAGRPRTGYLAVGERVDYRVLADVLARELGQTTETRARRAEHAGREWATRITPSPEPNEKSADDALDRAAARTTVAFTWMGFAPELTAAAEPTASAPGKGRSKPLQERVIRLHACPLREMARSHPDVVCGVHRGLLQGLVADAAHGRGHRGPARPDISTHLEPFVEPELCVARLVADG
jgi:predicted ArsR family transcriptional regulator